MDTFGVTLTKLKRLCQTPAARIRQEASTGFGLRRNLVSKWWEKEENLKPPRHMEVLARSTAESALGPRPPIDTGYSRVI